jgi:hypothetical protein
VKEIRLHAPDGTVCTGCSIADFIKVNTARFDSKDLIKRDGMSLSQTRAYQGISGLVRGRYQSWKGWRSAA